MGHRDLFINGAWVTGDGPALHSRGPNGDDLVWSGTEALPGEIDLAVDSARRAFGGWSQTSFEQRIEIARRFAERIKRHSSVFARLISREMGKPLWEAYTEVAAVAGKVDVTIDAYRTRCGSAEELNNDVRGETWYRPLGALGVLGPFNLPAHLPNGQIVPALLAGNTIVFKPSELTPAVGEMLVDQWREADLPAGVINLVQGGPKSAEHLARHPQLDGLLFTGSYRVGLELSKWYGAFPEKMLALEMGGNNPLVVDRVRDLDAASLLVVQSAYITSGQRCTCARRLIVVDSPESDEFLEVLGRWIDRIDVGLFDQEPEPFLGPVVSLGAAERLLAAQSRLIEQGARSLRVMRQVGVHPAVLAPGLIDVTDVPHRLDEEWFGPLLQVIRVSSWEAALDEANRTRFGLAAGLLSDDANRFQEFRRRVRAGVLNWNRATTGASARMPFGGLGASGNHRPAGYHAVDFCADAVASSQSETLTLPQKLPTGIRAAN